MEVEFLAEKERLVARPRGQMDAELGKAFSAAVERQLADGPTFLTIDLNELDFISLGGIRAILRLARDLRSSQTNLEFLHGSDSVREALHQAGLNNLFPFTPPYHHSQRGTLE